MTIMNNYILDDLKNYAINHLLYKSGNKVVDYFTRNKLVDMIRNVKIDSDLDVNMMEFVPYDQFNDIEYIAKFESYEATWIDGNIQSWSNEKMNFKRSGPMQVILKRLNNSENISYKELNKVLYLLI